MRFWNSIAPTGLDRWLGLHSQGGVRRGGLALGYYQRLPPGAGFVDGDCSTWDELELLDGYFGALVVVGFIGEQHDRDLVEAAEFGGGRA